MRPEYSVWLLPEAMQENALAQTIVSLATQLGESAFAPHVTIQGDLFQSPQQLAASLSRLAAETPVQRWRVQRVECSRHFFRCLFLRFANETVFEQLQSEVEACTRTREGLSPYPHLSLAYGPLRPETLKQRDELASAFSCIASGNSQTEYSGLIAKSTERQGRTFHLPTLASTSALRKRSTNSMNRMDGTSNSSAVIEAIW